MKTEKTRQNSQRRKRFGARMTITQIPRGAETVGSSPPRADQRGIGLMGGRPSGPNTDALLKAS